eukprot:410524-Hanusia_phi.AAC.1
MGVDWLILLFDVWSYASDMMVVKTVRRMRTHMLVYSNARMPPKTGLSLSTSSKLTPTSKLLKAVVKESKMFLYSAATDPKETWNAVANPKSRIASERVGDVVDVGAKLLEIFQSSQPREDHDQAQKVGDLFVQPAKIFKVHPILFAAEQSFT